MIDPTRRFSSRVDYYIRSRPDYPPEVLKILKDECGLRPDSLIADVGSGTGILTRLFLGNRNPVYAVEPNREMREAAERLLGSHHGFHSAAGTAESSTLAHHSVDFVCAGQAFHWFDREKAKLEFSRILRPGGYVVLIWNERQTTSTPFLRAYEELLQHCALDYREVDHRRIDQTTLNGFYGNSSFGSKLIPHCQLFNYDGLRDRLLSSSYVPDRDHSKFDVMLSELADVFQSHQVRGHVSFEYICRLYYGQING